jgi:hypothetical protein
MPGTLACELCSTDVARVPFEGLYLCTDCADSLPPRTPAPDEEVTTAPPPRVPRLVTVLDTILAAEPGAAP